MFNEKALSSLDLLNVLQYNVQNVQYNFIMSLFAYVLTGMMIVVNWICIYRSNKKLIIESILFSITGLILIQLGSISYSPLYRDRAIYILLLTLSFLTINAIGYLLIALKNISNKEIFWLNIIAGLFIIYDVAFKYFYYPNSAITAHISTVICFVWYFGLPKTLASSEKR
jgi:hypothetical protein